MRFLLLGTIQHRKGQQTLLEALHHLPLDVLDRSEFLIVGRPHDAKLAAQVRAATEVTRARLQFRETVGHQEALALIQETDVMLCTSSDETGPLILIEAMALGKPILSTKVGVVGENLITDEDALFVEARDAIALAGAIQRLVQEPHLLRKLATNARNAYERYFGLERFGNEFLRAVEEAIQNQSSLREEQYGSRCDSGANPTTSPLPNNREKNCRSLRVGSSATGPSQNSMLGDDSYAAWVKEFDTVGARERIVLRGDLRTLHRHPLISIVMPVYNPDLVYLSAAINSVRAQIYQNWELCIADDASTDVLVAQTSNEHAAADSRIKLTFRERNGHIAACSNSALQLANGDWVALLDQDDLLPEHALAVVAATIWDHPKAGLIYSDEDKIDPSGARCSPFFKPD